MSSYIRRMEAQEETESGAQAPDNSETWTLDTSGLEATGESLEQLIKNMEVLLSDVEELRSLCSTQTSELMQAAMDLKQQQDELKENYLDMSREMQEIMDTLESLFSSKSDFESKEKEADKTESTF